MEISNLKSYQERSDLIDSKKEELRVLKEKFESENAGLINEISVLVEAQDSEKSLIKEQAISEFESTGLKKLMGGIGIREGVDLDYDDVAAFGWAKEHSLCLALDKKEFEKIAKTQDIDFVTKNKKITVTFPAVMKLE